jgi:uncharacterized protein YggE
MRLVALGLALALGAAPASLPAQAPLAPGEVLLELGSIGAATVPADLATLNVSFGGTGATEAAARAAFDARYERIIAAARRAGVPAAAITRRDAVPIQAAIRAIDVAQESPPGGPATPAAEPYYTYGFVSVRTADMARVDSIRAALVAAAGTEPGDTAPRYSLTESRAARQAARAQALTAVRVDAEAYAASLGMRVARIVRVSERTGVGLLPQLVLGEGEMMRQVFGPGQGREPDITVFVVVGVDFALVPR